MILVLGLGLFGGWLWFRGSSFVAVDHVVITGAGGPDAPAIRTALRAAARDMTTLDVQVDQLRRAVSQFPEVKDVRVRAEFPHRLRIQVIERLPVAMLQVGGRQIPVAGDRTLLRGLAVPSSFPVLPLAVPPVGRRLTERAAASDVAVLAAAPYRLLSRISQVSRVGGHGLVAQVRGGPVVYFGPPTQLAEKWIAASEVLADPGSAGASYIDVTDPRHPAAGEGSGSAAVGSASARGTSSGSALGTSSAAASSTGTTSLGATSSGAALTGSGAAASRSSQATQATTTGG